MLSRHLATLAAVVLAALSIAAPRDVLGDDAPPDVAPTAAVPRVVVVVEVAVNISPARADALAAALAAALNRELVVDALGGADVTRRLPPEGLPDECLGDPACIATIASRLEAQQLLFLAIVQVGDETHVDATWVDAGTGASASRPRAEVPSEALAVSVFAAMASRYLPDARVRDKTIVIDGQGGGGTLLLPAGDGRHLTRRAWISGGVAVGAGAGAVLLGLTTRSKYQRCERDRACSDDELDAIDRRALFADLALGVSVAAAATTIVFYMMSGDETAPAVAPEVTAVRGGAVLGLGGHF